jgi:thermitase
MLIHQHLFFLTLDLLYSYFVVYFNRMARKIVYLAFCFIVSLFIFGASFAYAEYAPGKILVKFKPGTVAIPKGFGVASVKAAAVSAASVKALNTKYGVVEIRQLYKKALENRPDWVHLRDNYILNFPKDKDVMQVVSEYRSDPNVVSASPCSIFRAADIIPNDPRFIDQWGLTKIKAPQAWDRTVGSAEVVIAVLDTGVDMSHEDLASKIDPRGGWNFVSGNDNPTDDFGHGTVVAGVIAAATNNGLGIAGVDWRARILPVKVLDNHGEGIIYDILDGIAYASSLSVEVINMSFGQYNSSLDKYVEEDPAGLKERCQDAYNNNVVLVASAGNGSVDWNSYPAYYSTVIAVAATDKDDKRSIWTGIDPSTGRTQGSNFGSWVDVAAPGTNIWSVRRGGGYDLNNGTSLSAPFVAGLAGLIKAVNPNLSNQEIINIIINTADNIDGLNPGYAGLLGSGRINAFRAVSGVLAEITSPANGGYVRGLVDVYGSAGGWGFSNYSLDVLQNDIVLSTLNSSSVAVEGGKLGSWQTSAFNGAYTLRLRVYTVGSATEEARAAVVVDNISPEAEILSLVDGLTLEGRASIYGSAKDQNFDHYVLEYGTGQTPAVFERIGQSFVAANSDLLGTWETSGLDGVYTLRLTAFDKAGGALSKAVWVNVRTFSEPMRQASLQPGLPLTYVLPNPFNLREVSTATFNYTLEGNFDTRIYLFDLSGALIWQKSYTAGQNGGKSGANNPVWDGTNLYGVIVPNGIYIYQVVSEKKIIAKGKIIVLN